LLVLAFGYLALTSIRNVIWWGWVTAPMIAANFAAIGANRAMRRAEAVVAQQSGPGAPDAAGSEPPTAGPRRVEVPALNWIIAVLLVGGALLFTPLWRPYNPVVPPKSVPALSEDTPVELASFLKQNQPPKPLF